MASGTDDGGRGHVEPGGAAYTWELAVPGGTVEIRKASVSEQDNNAYVVADVATGRGVLVDAADDAERLAALCDGVDIVHVVTTHRHWDHHRALPWAVRELRAVAHAGADDAEDLPVEGVERLDDGDVLAVDAVRLTVRHTPGHTPGSVCLLLETAGDDGAGHHLFTGDTLFPGGPGNTFGDDAAFRTIMGSLRERVFTLPDDTVVHPGHGDGTTLGAERPDLDAWAARRW